MSSSKGAGVTGLPSWASLKAHQAKLAGEKVGGVRSVLSVCNCVDSDSVFPFVNAILERVDFAILRWDCIVASHRDGMEPC